MAMQVRNKDDDGMAEIVTNFAAGEMMCILLRSIFSQV
jgi:hypothetical protein